MDSRGKINALEIVKTEKENLEEDEEQITMYTQIVRKYVGRKGPREQGPKSPQ